MPAVGSDPRAQYQRLLKARENLAGQLSVASVRFSWLRFEIAASAAIAAWKVVVDRSWDGPTFPRPSH